MAIKGKCGTDCSVCGFRDRFECKGCVDQNGKVFWGECEIYGCAAGKELEHCGMCGEMPCGKLMEFIENGHNPDRMDNLIKWKNEI